MSITINITTSSVIGQEQTRTVKFSDASFSTDEALFMAALSKEINEFVKNYKENDAKGRVQ